ncbi:hypothetical protein [Methylobacterium sp. E-045]|uniref:hypothetical protein n=1 Tax=Methylobacterium sp. E-045 TaxID=2836575 RepID=UPI001FB8E8CE|nr:hypothetical protein [Methylobacterium sp. E-045]MCJ2129253.1 hypothetical protein [Methylobacterium sp. E-045]
MMACSCLTCAIRSLIESHAEELDRANPKAIGPAIDAVEAISALVDVAASLVAAHPNERLREQAMTFAHDALDKALIAHVTGVPQEVTVGGFTKALH